MMGAAACSHRRCSIDLVDHLDQRIAARDQDALLAIAGEHHVIMIERHRGADRGSLLAGAFHVEAGLALALAAIHPFIKRAGQRHRAQHLAQWRDEPGVPRPMAGVVAENADRSSASAASRSGCCAPGSLTNVKITARRGDFGSGGNSSAGRLAFISSSAADRSNLIRAIFYFKRVTESRTGPQRHWRLQRAKRV
jgi:hypothetical protein